MPPLIPRPTHKRFLQTNWLHRWLNTPSTRAGLALVHAHAHHPAMVRHATIQRQRPALPVTVVVPKEPMAGCTNAPFAKNDINAGA